MPDGSYGWSRHLAILSMLVFLCLTNSAHADVPPPAAQCTEEGAACEGGIIGIFGDRYQGTCIRDAEKRWYCKTGPTCYRARGPGDEPYASYGERPCYEVIVAVPSAMPVPSVAPIVESKPTSSCSISKAHRHDESVMDWLIIALIAAARRARRV